MSGPPTPSRGLTPSRGRRRDRAAPAERAARLLAAAAEDGRTAVVAYTNGRHFLAEPDPVWWLTGFKPMAECLALVAPDGEVDLLLTPAWDRRRAAETAPGVTVRTGDPVSALAAWLQRAGLTREDAAFWGGRKITAERAAAFGEVLGPLPGTDALFEQASRRRDAADLAAAEEATALAEQGFAELLRLLRPGMAEFEAVALLHLFLRDLGADDAFLLMSSSAHNLALHPPTDRILAPGDVVLAEISPAVDGVYTQICRTIVLGPASSQLRADFEMLSAALAAGTRACVPGATVEQAVAAMDAVIASGGYAGYCQPPHMRARGHGLGLGSTLPGDLTHDNRRQFEDGDFFVMHPNQYLPSSGYLLCGEPVAVTASGAAPLSGGFAALAEAGS